MVARIARVLLLAGLLAAPLWTAAAEEKDREFHWTGHLASGQVVEIKGITGDIRASGGTGDQIDVMADKSAAGAENVNIQVLPTSEGVTICAIYPSEDVGRGNTCVPGREWNTNIHHRIPRVDFTVRLPQDLRFVARNVNGTIEVTDLCSQVDADTVNGSVHISTAGWATAETVNGSITARIGKADWQDTAKFETVNGFWPAFTWSPSCSSLTLSNDRRIMRTINNRWQNFWIVGAAGASTAAMLVFLWLKLVG